MYDNARKIEMLLLILQRVKSGTLQHQIIRRNLNAHMTQRQVQGRQTR